MNCSLGLEEGESVRRQLFALTFVALPLAVALGATHKAAAQSGATPPVRSSPSSGVEIDALDRKTDPCTDFYQFACGGWIATNPVPADRRSWGRFQDVQDRNFTILRRILEARASAGDEGDRKKA